MPKRIRTAGRMKPIVEINKSPEELRLLENRTYRFTELVGDDFPKEDIDKLVESSVDYWDLDKLLKSGCDPHTAVKILI